VYRIKKLKKRPRSKELLSHRERERESSKRKPEYKTEVITITLPLLIILSEFVVSFDGCEFNHLPTIYNF
jgi:hypothetical protein